MIRAEEYSLTLLQNLKTEENENTAEQIKWNGLGVSFIYHLNK
jgi:hypothetical protein